MKAQAEQEQRILELAIQKMLKEPAECLNPYDTALDCGYKRGYKMNYDNGRKKVNLVIEYCKINSGAKKPKEDYFMSIIDDTQTHLVVNTACDFKEYDLSKILSEGFRKVNERYKHHQNEQANKTREAKLTALEEALK